MPPKTATKIHPLRTYIEDKAPSSRFGRKHPTIDKLAKASGLSIEAIYRVARGDYGLSANNARLLSKATRGAVPVSALHSA